MRLAINDMRTGDDCHTVLDAMRLVASRANDAKEPNVKSYKLAKANMAMDINLWGGFGLLPYKTVGLPDSSPLTTELGRYVVIQSQCDGVP